MLEWITVKFDFCGFSRKWHEMTNIFFRTTKQNDLYKSRPVNKKYASYMWFYWVLCIFYKTKPVWIFFPLRTFLLNLSSRYFLMSLLLSSSPRPQELHLVFPITLHSLQILLRLLGMVRNGVEEFELGSLHTVDLLRATPHHNALWHTEDNSTHDNVYGD